MPKAIDHRALLERVRALLAEIEHEIILPDLVHERVLTLRLQVDRAIEGLR